MTASERARKAAEAVLLWSDEKMVNTCADLIDRAAGLSELEREVVALNAKLDELFTEETCSRCHTAIVPYCLGCKLMDAKAERAALRQRLDAVVARIDPIARRFGAPCQPFATDLLRLARGESAICAHCGASFIDRAGYVCQCGAAKSRGEERGE